MSYQVGIDLGTTFTAAAVHRDGAATICTLGSRSAAIPSVVLIREDGAFLTGDAAERRAISEPERVVREFKRRLGDTTPILVAGVPHSPEELTARLLESVVYDIKSREGGLPGRIVVTHPANWGEYKRELLDSSIAMAGLDTSIVDFLTEPEAAALSYAAQERIHLGEVVAVYDLGGGTFDACVLQRTETGFAIVGRPEGIERLGGIDFDAAVFSHVTSGMSDALMELDPSDPTALGAVSRLKQDCVDAKEALSSDTDARIPVFLPNLQTEVRITRHEFESLIRPSLMDSMEAMRRAVRSARLELDDVSRVLLVGGSSRIPLVSQLVSIELGLPVAVDAHPKHAIALGAAFAAGGLLGRADAADVAAAAEASRALPVDFNPNMTVVAPAHLLKAEEGPKLTPRAAKAVPAADAGPPPGSQAVARPANLTSAERDPAGLDGPAPRAGAGERRPAQRQQGQEAPRRAPAGQQSGRPQRGDAPAGRRPAARGFEDPLDFDQDSAGLARPTGFMPTPPPSSSPPASTPPDGRRSPLDEIAARAEQGIPGVRPPGVDPGHQNPAHQTPGKARPVDPGRAGPAPSYNPPAKAQPVPASALSSPPPGGGQSVGPGPGQGGSHKAQPVPLNRLGSPPPGTSAPPRLMSPAEQSGYPPQGGIVSRQGSGPLQSSYPSSSSGYPSQGVPVGSAARPEPAPSRGGSKVGWIVVALVVVALVVVGVIIFNQSGA